MILLFLFQYSLLSGLAPFSCRPQQDTASSIMRRIKEGDFRLEGEAWACVSPAAKTLCKGLLTVDPRRRISMAALTNSAWLSRGASGGSSSSSSGVSLMTPALMICDPTTERCIKQTYDAFHNATREGFRLVPVSASPSKLLQKRKLKQSVSTETTLSSASSDRSSFGSKSSGSGASLSAASAKLWSGAVHAPKAAKESAAEVFSFKGSSVADYLAYLPSSSSSSSPAAAAASSSAVAASGSAPFNLPLSVQVSAFSSHHHHHSSHHHHHPSPPSTAATLLAAYPSPSAAAASAYPLGNSGVSLSVISPPVIRPSAAAASSHAAAVSPAASSGPCSCDGPLTRARKRKQCELHSAVSTAAVHHSSYSAAATAATSGKSKTARLATITIE